MSVESLRSSQPIPGYTITQRIGAGGYGEVWRADAPGGLVKAVKLVYGYHDEERASRELRALNRIKQVRHPFLLSLERIEVVDGQLVIVTELADMCLKDRFEQCKAAGLPGIPREELLVYLHDAADALDYMSEQFGLQHLDVKPENLLLLGGRVKVADFGLVKDLQEATCSMMGGMTPLYASPEVFDGRATRQSDQYSLAIVYQEMLTGVLPFPGKTVAQLAAQHMQSRPKLSALPPFDQPIILRSLSKTPDERFASTRELIDVLITAGKTAAGRAKQSPPPARVDSDADTASVTALATEIVSRGGFAPADRAAEGVEVERLTPVRVTPPPRAKAAPPSLKLPDPVPAELRESAPIDPSLALCGLRPTLYVGIGGTAARILLHLRSRLGDRFGDLTAMPCWPMLLLDTDAKALTAATAPVQRGALDLSETVALPLRKPQDYGADIGRFVQWLSRRWIYNIPRSLQTGGMRPLGRLALSDHADEFLVRLRHAVQRLAKTEDWEAASRHSGLPLRSRKPQAVVVASISGGTASGTVLDVARSVRDALAAQGLADEDVTLFLTHSTPRVSTARDLAAASAYAFLSEWAQLARQGQWPSGMATGATGFDERAPAAQAYLVHLGDELSEQQWDDAAESLADYLALEASSAVGSLLDAARSGSDATTLTTLRTCGLRAIGGGHERLTAVAADLVARATLEHWSGETGDPSAGRTATTASGEPSREARRFTQVELLAEQRGLALGLESSKLMADVSASFERQAGSEPEGFARSLVNKLLGELSQGAALNAAIVAERVNSVLGSYATGANCGHGVGSALLMSVEGDLRKIAAPRAEALEQWLLQLVDMPGVHLAGAQHATLWFANRFRALEEEAAQSLEETAQALAETAQQSGGKSRLRWSGRSAQDATAWAFEFCRLRMRENLLHAVRRFLQLLASRLSSASDQIRDLRREVSLWSNTFPSVSAEDLSGAGHCLEWPEYTFALTNYLRGRVPELGTIVADRLRETLLASGGGLRRVLTPGTEAHALLGETLKTESRRAVVDALEQFDAAGRLLDGTLGAKLDEHLAAWLEAARPRLMSCGGSRRTWLIARGGSTAQALADRLSAQGAAVSQVPDASGQLALVCEGQEIPVVNAALALVDGRADVAAIAQRLHTRVDVSWQPLS